MAFGSIWKFGADNSEYKKAVREMPSEMDKAAAQIESRTAQMGSRMSTAMREFSGILAGGMALAGLKSLMDGFDKVSKTATRFGASAEEVQRVGVAAELAGTSIDTVARVLTKLSVAASDATNGNAAMAKAFEKAGINAEKFKNSGLDQQLIQLSQAFNQAKGDADATNQIIELMGTRAASQMIPLIDNTAQLRAEMEGVSVASDDVVRKIEAANDRMTRLGNDIKVVFADLLQGLTDSSERIGSVLAQTDGLFKLLDGLAKASRGNFLPLFEVLGTARTIAEMEQIEARATAIAQLTREGAFGLDAVRNAELIADRTKQVLENVRGTKAQLDLSEDTTAELVRLESDKADQIDRQNAAMERQEQQRQDAIRAMEAEIALMEAKLAGNKELEESLRQQADFQAALQKTGSFETAANFSATKAAERAQNSSQRIANEEANARALYGPRGGGTTAPPTEGMRAAMLRGESRGNRARQRGNELAEAGMYRSAVQAFDRADRTADRIAENQRVRDFYGTEFGAGNAGEAFGEFRDMFGGLNSKSLIEKGLEDAGLKYDPTRDEQANFDRLAREQSKTPEERAREEEEMRQKHAPRGGGGDTEQGIINQIHSLLQKHMPSIDEKLPQHALVPG
jgi:hypothetical protein